MAADRRSADPLHARAIAPALAVLVALAMLGGCGDDGAGDASQADAAGAAADPGFQSANALWRLQRVEALSAADGWASLIGLYPIELRAHYVGSDASSGLRLAHGPPKLGLLQQDGGRLYFTPERGVVVTRDGEPLPRGRVELRDDRDPAPTVLGFDDGKGRFTVIERNGRRALRAWHADAESRLQFGRLDYWPADPGWQLTGRFEPHPAGQRLEIVDILGHLRPMANPGAVVFERDGASHRLEALDGGDGALFLMFADRTSGHDSYGAGRYLYTAPVAADGSVVLDFNRAINPPCAFTDFATCPLPPASNRLDVAITAGEKRYARHTTPAPKPQG